MKLKECFEMKIEGKFYGDQPVIPIRDKGWRGLGQSGKWGRGPGDGVLGWQTDSQCIAVTGD